VSLEFAIGDRLPYVNLLGASGDVPVDSADVIAGNVPSGFAWLRTVSGDKPEVVSVQHAIELHHNIKL
jgi:hypothetical protein